MSWLTEVAKIPTIARRSAAMMLLFCAMITVSSFSHRRSVRNMNVNNNPPEATENANPLVSSINARVSADADARSAKRPDTRMYSEVNTT